MFSYVKYAGTTFNKLLVMNEHGSVLYKYKKLTKPRIATTTHCYFCSQGLDEEDRVSVSKHMSGFIRVNSEYEAKVCCFGRGCL